ncbi:MAG: TldD/PmbA family protein [Acidobacteriota bacterium]
MQSRREFTKALGLGAVGLTLGPYQIAARQSAEPFDPVKDPKYRTWSEDALREARRLGCTYADIRFTRNRSNGVAVRNGQIVNTGNIGFGQFGDEETYGFGVRVIHSGVWGFASSPIVTPAEIRRIVGLATDVAKASAMSKRFDVRLSPVRKHDTFWQTPIKVDPWSVPLEDKVAQLIEVTQVMQKNPDVAFATAAVNFNYEWKFLATSDGSFIEQVFYYTAASATATARKNGVVKSRTYNPGTETRGWEFFTEKDLIGNAERVAAEAVEHAMAKPVGSGLKDLVLLPSHSALTIHEIIGHPTELDRIVGYEANYAGTSFITLKDVNRLRYGSKLMNVYADRTHPGGASTVGYDDDGVEAQRWPLVREGVLVDLQTNRETAHYLNQDFSRGCTFANHWRNFPFLRMPNVQMEPGPEGSPTVDQMIADVKDGVLVDGQGSFSIDQQRYNGQFGGDAFWEIRNGKRTRMVTDFTYNAITTEFWANLDAVGPPGTWEHHGMGGDAKGQPVQSNRPSHGSAPMLFRRIMVGTAFA